MLYQFVQKRAASISLCTFAGTCDSICLKWTSFKYLNNSFTVMVIVLLWMVVEFENASSEVQKDQQSEAWNKFSVALHILLPVAGLALFLRQKDILSRLLLQLDRNCVSVFCPSFSRREKLLRWAGSRLPETWSSQSRTLSGGILELWVDGSLLCTLINSAIPGACLNPHRHWKKPPLHAQALAYKYLGVVPIFTEKDLLGELNVMLEKKFLHYLTELQQAILKLTERNELNKTTSALYIARGMGLYTGEQHRKTVFYMYPNTPPTICNNSNIIIHVRGPYGTYGKAIIPKFNNDLFATKKVKLPPDLLLKRNFLQNSIPTKNNPFMKNFSLPFMHYHKKHMGDNIVIHITMEDDRAKVTYIPKNYGMYEIIMISNGELIRGCPFNVHILNNTSGIQETLESEEKEEEIPHVKKRKVISKTIDFIDEEMPIADLKKRYKRNQVKQDETTNFKRVVDELSKKDSIAEIVEKDETDNQNNLDTVVDNNSNNTFIDTTTNLQYTSGKTKSVKMQSKKEKIDEEEECEVLSREESSADEIDSSKISNDNTIDENISEKQNRESTKENRHNYKLYTSEKDIKVEPMSDEIKEVDDTVKVICDGGAEGIQEVVDNNVTTGVNVVSSKAKVVHDDEGTLVKNDTDDDAESVVDDEFIKKSKTKITNDSFEGKLTLNEYPKPITVNKIQIPEKFSILQNLSCRNPVDSVADKHFTNTNYTNKGDFPRHLLHSTILREDDVKRITKTIKNYPMLEPKMILHHTDDNDSGNDTISSIEDNEVKQNLVKALTRERTPGDIEKAKAVPRRFFQVRELPNDVRSPSPPLERENSISPICSDHIAPEVNNEFKLLSVAERRKIFVQQPKSISQSMNSSFSVTENIEAPQPPKQFKHYEGLSVLNFLGSLKETENARKVNNYVLSSTKSLPNIPSVEDEYSFRNSVRDRKQFWENLSSSSTHLNTHAEPICRKNPKRMTEEERLRLIWKKPIQSETLSNNTILEERLEIGKDSEICKSADDILSITNYAQYQNPKKYRSLDDALDNCTVLSIEERKKKLLRQNYEKEKIDRGYHNISKKNIVIMNQSNTIKNIREDRNGGNSDNDVIVFSPVVDKIKKFDSAYSLIKQEEKKDSIEVNTNAENKKVPENSFVGNNRQDVPGIEKITLKSHFKKAIRYFKDLEEKSLGKSKPKAGKMGLRRYSLDIRSNNHKNMRRGGSLNLLNVSERFSINSIYKDVFGERRGSFKGAPNRGALVEALATFSRKENPFVEDNVDDIRYDIFKKRAKSKRRKSIRTIFDVYY